MCSDFSEHKIETVSLLVLFSLLSPPSLPLSPHISLLPSPPPHPPLPPTLSPLPSSHLTLPHPPLPPSLSPLPSSHLTLPHPSPPSFPLPPPLLTPHPPSPLPPSLSPFPSSHPTLPPPSHLLLTCSVLISTSCSCSSSIFSGRRGLWSSCLAAGLS